MTQVQRLNLKFTIADTDRITHLCANSRMTDLQIVSWFKRLMYVDLTAEEVRRICVEAGHFIRIDQRKGVQ